MSRKPSIPKGMALSLSTGKIEKVHNITESSLQLVKDTLNEQHGLLQECAKWTHDKKLDAKLSKATGQ